MRGLASSLLSLLTQAMIAECFRVLEPLSLGRSRAGSRPGPRHSHVSQDKTIGGSSIAPVGGCYYWTGLVRLKYVWCFPDANTILH